MSTALQQLPNSAWEAMQERGLYPRQLQLRANSANEQERSFIAVAATETRAHVFDYETYQVVEEILIARGGIFPESIPLLDSHMRWQVDDILGMATAFRLEADEWIAKGIVDDDGGRATRAFKKILRGFLRAVSIGYKVREAIYIPAGKTHSIQGRQFKAGETTLKVSTAWEVHELSLTAIPADRKAIIRSKPVNSAPITRSHWAR